MARVEEGSLEAITREWDALADRTGALPFVRPGWIRAWQRAFGSSPLSVLALRRNGTLAAVLPVECRRGALRSPTNWHTPVFGPVGEDAAAMSDLAAGLFAREPSRVRVGFVDVGSPELPALRASAEGAGYRILERTLLRSPYVPTSRPRAEWEDRVGSKHLREVRRRRRRLAEDHGAEVAIHVLDGTHNLDALLLMGFELEGSGWKAERGTAILSRPETRRFYTDVARWAAERGWLRLAFVHLGDRPIAFEMQLEANDSIYVLKGGFDRRYAKYAPGALLTHDGIARCFERGLASYEFLGDVGAHKQIWASDVRERLLLQAFARSPAGLAAHTGHARLWPFLKRLKGSLSR
jgi:CelD/BcsL family acetyltransferase involved in cellulose biosynthesis